MTDDMVSLRALIEKTLDADLLRDGRLRRARLMELEIGELTGAAYGGKSAERLAERNGYRDRLWENRAGKVEAPDPQAAPGQLLPWFPRAAPGGREGAHCGDPGGLLPRRLNPLGRGTGARPRRPLGRRPFGNGSMPLASMGMTGISKSQPSHRDR